MGSSPVLRLSVSVSGADARLSCPRADRSSFRNLRVNKERERKYGCTKCPFSRASSASLRFRSSAGAIVSYKSANGLLRDCGR